MLNNGLYNGNILTHHSGISQGELMGLCGPDDSRSDYCIEAKILFSAMSAQPTEARKVAINDFIVGCKQDGNWFNLDVLWFTASHDEQAAKLNWINPSLFTLTAINSPTFTIDRGYLPNGVSSYLKTGFNPRTNGQNYTLDVNSYGIYSRSNNNGSYDFCASDTVTMAYIFCRNGSNQFGTRNNSTSGNTFANSDSRGLFCSKRSLSTGWDNYINNTLVNSANISSSAIPNQTFYLGAFNNNGSVAGIGSKEISFCFIGGGINIPALYNRAQTYLTVLGANV